MARRDDFHFKVIIALEKEGWTITDDPLLLKFEDLLLQADLGAERALGAEKAGRKIAVEVKDFDGASTANELQKMAGQLLLHQWSLDEQEPDRELFLAVSNGTFDRLFQKPSYKTVTRRNKIKLVVFDESTEVILQWINPDGTPTS